jgi:transcriptional regulator with XRE-family HTH domain
MRRLTPGEQEQHQKRGVRVAQALDFSDITQQEIAKKLGVRQSYISAIISGNRPGLSLLSAIAKVTKVPLRYIESGEGWKPLLSDDPTTVTPEQTSLVAFSPKVAGAFKSRNRAVYALSGPAMAGVAHVLTAELGSKISMKPGDVAFVVILTKP